jgi:Zn finger protein HypA/HybF involved in hydrogenase expression
LLNIVGIAKDAPLVRMPLKETPKVKLEIGELEEMRKELYKKMDDYLAQETLISDEERRLRLESYVTKMEDIKIHLIDNITEEMLFAMALQAEVKLMMSDLDTHAPEYIAQKVMEVSAKFILPETVG